ncbi:hypothetical protein TD95_001513 [Thielaviopsis punctulata]|uniref:Uncharacterized protein n=1 Tax=Thielaviopsis punctulata TaxID=72032 RepID=A0A0F4ZHL3_9PEZI|nr:hypothetical protein TD95_001513 [Thielaviopsis punctulata]
MAPSWDGQHNGQVKLGGPGHWWATSAYDYSLDVITLLAVIGEQSMADHSQVINVDPSCYLPRLLPAPQAFLKPNRPNSLPHVSVKVIGARNGSLFGSISLFADSLLPESVYDMKKYTFRAVKIEYSKKCTGTGNETGHGTQKLTANKGSPLVWLAYFSFFLSVGILIMTILLHDGMGIFAVTTLSLASSLIGVASKWAPSLTTLNPTNKEINSLPASDVILQNRAGAFVLVKCTEPIARELFAGTHECNYALKSTRAYSVVMSMATVLIMISVIFLGNCRWEVKAAIGGAYILLNLLYWIADMYEPKKFWDLTRYHVTPLPSDEQDWQDNHKKFPDIEAQKNIDQYVDAQWVDNQEGQCFTRVVWQVIYSSGTTAWADKVLPDHNGWKAWLKEAKGKLENKDKTWKAVEAKDRAFAANQVP